MNSSMTRASNDIKTIKRISGTSWIGNVGGDLNDFQVNVDDNSRAGSTSGELKLVLADVQSSDSSNNGGEGDLKAAVNGIADMKLKGDSHKDGKRGPLHASVPTTTTTAEKSSSTHRTGSHRNSGGSRRKRRERISIFTSHTTPSMVSSSYHSSELDDSFSEDEISDSELESSSDDESLEASIPEESRDGEDDIKSILSSDFDSCDLELDDDLSESNNKSKEDGRPVPEQQQEVTTPQPDKRSKLYWTNDKRWATLETSPMVNPDPFVYREDQKNSRMISNTSSVFVQVDRNSSTFGNRKGAMEIIMQGDDEISLNDGGGEYEQGYNDAKKNKKKSVADVLERDPDSHHTSFLLEVGMQRNVSGLSIQSGLLMQHRSSTRTRRKGSKRTRTMNGNQTWQNDVWDQGAPERDTLPAIPNQPLPPPPARAETPNSQQVRRSFSGAEIVAHHSRLPKRSSKSKLSHHSRVSALSTPSMDEPDFNSRHNRSRSNSFESSWDSTIEPSPLTGKKKLRADGIESVGGISNLTSPDNPTFRAGNRAGEPSLDVPPPPPARIETPRTSFQLPADSDGRPQLVDMRSLSKTSTMTFESFASAQSAKQRNREKLERLNDQMIAAIGVSTPGLARKSSKESMNLSIGERRESMKRLREKLRDSFKHAISPSGPSRKAISPHNSSASRKKTLSPTTTRKTHPHRAP